MKNNNAKVSCVIIDTWKVGAGEFWTTTLTVEFKSGKQKRYYGNSVEEILLTLPHKERYTKFKLHRKKELPDVTIEWWTPEEEA